MVHLEGKHLQLLRSPNGTHISQGKVDSVSKVGPWPTASLRVLSSVHCLYYWIWSGGHFLRTLHPICLLSLWHQPGGVHPPPLAMEWLRMAMGLMSGEILQMLMGQPIFFYLVQSGRHSIFAVGELYQGIFLLERDSGWFWKTDIINAPSSPVSSRAYGIPSSDGWSFPLPSLPQSLCVPFQWLYLHLSFPIISCSSSELSFRRVRYKWDKVTFIEYNQN